MNRFLRHIACIWLALAAALASTPASSQFTSDIDIYGIPSNTTDLPNVLIVLDNTANWSSMFTRELNAMIQAFNSLPVNRFRVGLMMYTESGNGNSGPDGGYVRAAVRDLTSDYRGKLGALLDPATGLNVNDDKSNGGKVALTMAEAYNYFAGLAPVSGNNKNKTDFTGNNFGTSQSRAIYGLQGNALGTRAGNRYVSPVTGGCARNFIIFVSNGPAQDNSSDNTSASSALSAAYQALGMTRPPDITGLSPADSQSNVADEWARFMRASPQAVATYTMDVDPGTSGQGPGWTALLKSMAARSGGEYFKINSSNGNGAEVTDAMLRIFNQIQAIDSVFVSASLPINLDASGRYLNQVYVGMFRPDGNANPRWPGNLKQYRFGYDPQTDTVSLVDANGQPAVSGATGFVSPNATSIWSSASTFWSNDRRGTPPSASDAPDGEVVEKGGVAQRLRTTYATSQAGRKVYTCIACATQPDLTAAANSLVTTNTAITTGTLGLASTATAERDALINWLRGTDNMGDESGPGGGVTVRPSIHGDVLHSRPVVVNYGSNGGVVVYYGANDGMLRAVNGAASGTGAGEELWAFMPQEHLPKAKRLRDNSPEVRLSVTSAALLAGTTPPQPRDYFVDGPIGLYQVINSSGVTTRAILYVGMRRGGRLLYALDVTTPGSPRFLWKKDASNLPVLGQTWSEPRVARIKGNANPVLVMGAGYDNTAEDAATPGTTTMGNAVLVMDAITGAVLQTFNTVRSVPADVSLVDSDSDGYIDRAYAADMGGNLYRIDFETATGTSSSPWGIYPLAALAGGTTRKFFFRPEVVLGRDATAILIGSGDREKPLAATASDAFFTVFDNRTAKGTPSPTPTVANAITPTSLGVVGSSTARTAAGCYLPMTGAGEKVVNASLTRAGVTYFNTNRPLPAGRNSCSANLGLTKSYAVPLFCKSGTSAEYENVGLPPNPISVIVDIAYTDPLTGQEKTKTATVNVNTLPPANSGDAACKPPFCSTKPPPLVPRKTRSYWFSENPR